MSGKHLIRAGVSALVMTAVACGGVTTGLDPNGGGDVAITEVIPAAGPLGGGIQVQITGTQFIDENLLVTFGGAPGGTPSVQEDGSIITTLPARSQAGFVDVVVANAKGQATLEQGFEYRDTAAIAISGVNPNCGAVAGGTDISISGTGFDDGSGSPVRVSVGGNLASNVVVVSNLEVTATTPGGTLGAFEVSIENGNGTAGAPNAFTYSGDCSGGPGGSNIWGALVDIEYVIPRGDAPQVSAFAYFFPDTSFTIPSTGSCVLDPGANITQFYDAGNLPTLDQPSGTTVDLIKQTSQGNVFYDSGALDTTHWAFGENVTLDVPGGADVQAFTAADIAAAPAAEFGIVAQYGFATFETGLSFLTSAEDVWLAWGDQKDANGDWIVDPFFGGPVASPVGRVQIIAMSQDLAGVNHYLVCEGLDTGAFCIRGGDGDDVCTTTGNTMNDLFVASGGDQIGFTNGLVGVIRTNHELFDLPNGSKGAIDIGVQKVADLTVFGF